MRRIHILRPGTGLSPRVRGNHAGHRRRPCRLGSIPACAGEPASSMSRGRIWRVYPRVCGGTQDRPAGAFLRHGLSPRVRGNLAALNASACGRGSIPACAGEPRILLVPRCVTRVYPRVCGGTMPARPYDTQIQGLSPRVRGNPPSHRGRAGSQRSIPACAGEPASRPGAPAVSMVYPRVCGGTVPAHRRHPGVAGLSPRVRGNLQRQRRERQRIGSIPACAGEPWAAVGEWWKGLGLSPRVRGNRESHERYHQKRGSIPACAGEPISQCHA